MLILTRRPEESIYIGPTVRVMVLGIRGRQVRLGIVAPSQVNIWREELEWCEECDDSLDSGET
jgi:carbon storage regulator